MRASVGLQWTAKHELFISDDCRRFCRRLGLVITAGGGQIV
jgi:hypothetical protein